MKTECSSPCGPNCQMPCLRFQTFKKTPEKKPEIKRVPLTRQQREFVRFGLNQRNYPVNEEDFAEYVRLIEKAHGIDA